MTRRDFRLIATVLATRESEIEKLDVSDAERLACRFAHRKTAFDFAWELDHSNERFDREVFLAWALPIYTHRKSL